MKDMNDMEKGLSLAPSGFLTHIENITIGKLVQDPTSELHYKNGKLSIRNQTGDRIIALEIASFSTGRESASFSSVPSQSLKRNYLDDILQMQKEGMKQKDIAFKLNISASYVSDLLKKHHSSSKE